MNWDHLRFRHEPEGGMGSGWYLRWNTKETSDNCRAIDVRRLQRDGLLIPSQSFGWQWLLNGEVIADIGIRTDPGWIIFTYRHRGGGEDWKNENYPVYLDWTSCNFGGRRPWFLCPAAGCGRRVAIFYCSGIFACRHCHSLAYPCQREDAEDRIARRADRIRGKLGWELGILNGNGGQPKGMHLKTFEYLSTRHDACVAASIAGMAERFNLSAKIQRVVCLGFERPRLEFSYCARQAID